MRLNPGPEPIIDDDEVIRASLSVAMPPPLLASVAAITGDLSLLRDDLRRDPTRFLEPEGGYTAEQLAEAREIAAVALMKFRDRGCVPSATPTGATLRRLIEWVAGAAVDDGILALLQEELALAGADLRAPQWQKGEIAGDTDFTVAIIGAGMSGIAVAHRLRQAGVPFVIFEKNSDVGGTWFENSYPGCRVDIANHFYSYSFAQTHDWPQFYSTQQVLLDYFGACADQLGLREHIRFDTEVVDAAFDDEQQVWEVRTRDLAGREASQRFQAIVSAVGQLNRPKMPDIAGIDGFGGPSFHSARWDYDVELRGKRVAVIGTGASAAQFIPVVAEEAAELTVFQRTPPWFFPVPNYMDDVPSGLRWLQRHVPDYGRWDRLMIVAIQNEGILPMCVVDPEWEHPDRSVSAMNDVLREMFTMYYTAIFADPQLCEKALPTYPPIAKRVVLDNGSLPIALQRDNVELVTDAIAEITERGLVTCDGRLREFDVVIYGTGFEASKFLMPMHVVGSGGVDLHERWAGDARAYLGITVPGFPNLFMMYGPNTNIVINGSIIYFSECETHYIVESIRMLLEWGAHSMDCRKDVHDAYNERIDAGNKAMAWGASDVNSWYKNEFGRVAQNWPFNLLEYWEQTRSPAPDDYVLR